MDLPLNRGLSHLIQLLSNETSYSSPRLSRYVFGFREGWGDHSTSIPHRSKELVTLIFQIWKCLDFLFGKLPNFSLDQRLVDGRCENIDIPFIHMAARNRFKLCYARLLSLKGHGKAQVDVVCLCV